MMESGLCYKPEFLRIFRLLSTIAQKDQVYIPAPQGCDTTKRYWNVFLELLGRNATHLASTTHCAITNAEKGENLGGRWLDPLLRRVYFTSNRKIILPPR